MAPIRNDNGRVQARPTWCVVQNVADRCKTGVFRRERGAKMAGMKQLRGMNRVNRRYLARYQARLVREARRLEWENARALLVPQVPKRLRSKCGAKCRDGHACCAPSVIEGGRCRMHGGLSTGPKTEAGRAAIAESNRRRALAKRQERASIAESNRRRALAKRQERASIAEG
jgi:hypothetical protein